MANLSMSAMSFGQSGQAGHERQVLKDGGSVLWLRSVCRLESRHMAPMSSNAQMVRLGSLILGGM